MTHRLTTALAGIALLATATSPALAQSDPAAGSPAAVPGMATMDRFDGQTKLATSLSYLGVDDSDVTALHFDLYGQYMAAQGFGGYGTIGLNYVSNDGESEDALGNIEVGGLYLIPGATPIVLRGGLVIATADDEDLFTNLIGAFARFTDYPQYIGSTTWLRLSAHPIIRRGNAFFKADGGIDIPIDDDDLDLSANVRVNIGGGIETGGVAIMGELVNTYFTDGDLDDQLVNTVAITGRFMQGGAFQPAVSFVLPLDDEYNDAVDWVLILGLEYVLPTAG